MKKTILTLFLLKAVIVFSQEKFQLSGKIQNPSQDFATFTLFPNWISEAKIHSLKLDTSGRFFLEFPLDDISYCSMNFGEYGLDLLKIEPGDSLSLSFDNSNFYESFAFIGKGAGKLVYQWMNMKKFSIDRDREMELVGLKKQIKDAFLQQSNALLAEQLQFLGQFKSGLSMTFDSLQTGDLLAKAKLRELGFLNSNGGDISGLNIDWGSFSEIAKSKSIYLGQLAEAFINKALSQSRYVGSPSLEYEFIKSYTDTLGANLTDRILAAKLVELINLHGDTEEIKLLVGDYNNNGLNERYKIILNGKIKKEENLKIGKPAPNFILKNKRGRLTELSDFRGKNLVIGFYNNQCEICFDDMEALRIVGNYFEQAGKNDLEFIFLNLSNPDAFKDFLKGRKTFGQHLQAYGDNFVSRNYNTTNLPNYLIVDKSGIIANNEVIEPRLNDGRSLIEDLERLIYIK